MQFQHIWKVASMCQDQDPQSFRNKPGKEKNYHTCGQVQEIESSPDVGTIPAWLRNDGARHRSGSWPNKNCRATKSWFGTIAPFTRHITWTQRHVSESKFERHQWQQLDEINFKNKSALCRLQSQSIWKWYTTGWWLKNILKNNRVRQWEGWHAIYYGK